MYGELVLVGSPDVIVNFNKFVKEWVPNKPETEKLYFNVFYSIHEDLYQEALPLDSIKVISGPTTDLKFLQEHSTWLASLHATGISSWKSLLEVNESSLTSKIAIPRDVLSRLKAIASNEVRREEERRKFFGEV